MQVGLGDFDRVAENPVKADLERGDSRPFPFLFLQTGDETFSRTAQTSKLVKLRAEAVLDDSSFAQQESRLLQDGSVD